VKGLFTILASASRLGRQSSKFKTILPFILSAAFCLLPGCMAAIQDIETLKSDVGRLQSDNANLKKELEKFRDKSTVGIAGEESFNAIRQSQAEIQSQISSVTKESQVLSGKFEENKDYTEKKLRDTGLEMDLLRAQFAAVETQVKEVKNKMNVLDDRSRRQEPPKEQPKQAEKKPEEVKKEQAPAQEQPAKPAATTGVPSKAKYDDALKTYNGKKYKEAREKFEAFLKEFPKDQLAENAYFWISETYYSEKDFEGAIVAYESLLKKYPKGQKTPTALFKQALSFIEIGDKKSGKVILEQLIEKYPKSQEAGKAKIKLQELEKQPAKKPVKKKKK
jgi:tol-pal system protein YbgF